LGMNQTLKAITFDLRREDMCSYQQMPSSMKVFPYYSRNKEDRPAPIPVEEEDPTNNLTKDNTRQRDPEPS